ncbi:MAG: GNAT family protein [Pseudomonadota bacterium]
MPWPEDVTLKGEIATIAPLEHAHAEDLKEATSDGELHKLWYTTAPSAETMTKDIDSRLALRKAGSMLPFSVFLNETGKAVGMTTYLNIDAAHRRIEIGGTWYRKSTQRTGLNTECKFLLLRHAFEELDCIAVEFRTHFMNQQSRRAIERLGAKFDGILRAHMIIPNGTIRDTAVYSLTAPEWPAAKANLTWQMEKPR